MKSQQNTGSIPVPDGDTKTETPDGVSKTYDNGESLCNSAYDARWFGDGMSFGAFPYESDDAFSPYPREPKRESTRRKGDD